jgi:hypothetical protein
VNHLIVPETKWKEVGFLPRSNALYVAASAFTGATKTGEWEYYESKDVDDQLGYLRGVGINCVRVFLDVYAYQDDPDVFLWKIKDYAKLCEKHKIRIMWVLFDDITTPGADDAGAGTEYVEGFSKWFRGPTSEDQHVGWQTDEGDAYLSAVVGAVSGSQATLLWDMFNEPSFSSTDPSSVDKLWIVSAHGTIVNLDPQLGGKHHITQGWAAIGDYDMKVPSGTGMDGRPNIYNDVASALSGMTDVWGYHPYTNSFQHRYKAVRETSSMASATGIPILMSEAVAPAAFSQWADNVSGFEELNVGWLMFQGIIGRVLGAQPFNSTQGLFHPDGQVRRLSEAEAVRDAAERAAHMKRRQLNFDLVEKVSSVDGGADGGYTSSLNALVWSDSFDANRTFWEIIKATIDAAETTSAVSRNYSPYAGDPLQDDLTVALQYVHEILGQEYLLSAVKNWTSLPALSSIGDGNPVFRQQEVGRRHLLLDNIKSFFIQPHYTIENVNLSGTLYDISQTTYDAQLAVSSTQYTTSSRHIFDDIDPRLSSVNSIPGTDLHWTCRAPDVADGFGPNGKCLYSDKFASALDWAAYDAVYLDMAMALSSLIAEVEDLNFSFTTYTKDI